MSLEFPDRAAATIGAAPALKVVLDDRAALAASGDELTAELADSLAERTHRARAVHLEIWRFGYWPAAARTRLLRLLPRGPGVQLDIELDGVHGSDLFELLLEGMPGPDAPVAEQAAAHRAIVETAAALYGDVAEVPAAAIAARRSALQLPPINAATLAQQIRAAHRRDFSDARPGAGQRARAAAEAFLDALRTESGAAADEPVLLRHRVSWLLWTGAAWRVITEEELEARLVRSLGQREMSPDAGEIRRCLRPLVFIDDAALAPPCHIASLDPCCIRPARCIALRNGVIDIDEVVRTGRVELHPLSSRWFTSAPLPYAWDPHAEAPLWQRYLDRCLPHSEPGDNRQALLHECLFDALTLNRRHEQALLLHGPSQAGKSVALAVFEAVLGGHVRHVPLHELGRHTHLLALDGKAANISSESGEKPRVDHAMLKEFISGEALTVPRSGGRPADVRPTAMLVLAANKRIDFGHADDSLWRRLMIMPFDRPVPPGEADVTLARRIIDAELPGILNLVLAAGVELTRRGHLVPCSRCARESQAYRTAYDDVAQFLAECCSREDPDICTARQDIQQAYENHCRRHLRRRPLERSRLGEALRTFDVVDGGRGPEQRDGRRPRLYRGISLTAEGEALLQPAARAG